MAANEPVVAIAELDALMIAIFLPVCVHAYRTKQFLLLGAGLLCGYLVETACVRLGGTHCHESGIVNVSPCSSMNSVLFYGPWIYVSVVGGEIMSSSSVISRAAWTGLFTGLVCWCYEMQGPLTSLWHWPDKDGLVVAASKVGDFQSLANKLGRGLVTDPFAFEALSPELQVFGFPIMAPFFDMAFGVGIGGALCAFPLLPKVLSITLVGPVLAVVFIRVPMFIADKLNASLLVTAPCVMALVVVVALLTMEKSKHDHGGVLVVAPLTFQAYWAAFTLRAEAIPPELKIVILSISVASFLIWRQTALEVRDENQGSRNYVSWLDRIQEDAHASELDFTNTPWWCFVLLSFSELVVMLCFAYSVSLPLFLVVFPIASHVLGFLFAVGMIGSCKYFDIWGEVTFTMLYLWSYSHVTNPTPRHQLLMFCQLCWVVRLGCFLGWRIFVRGSDFRFDKLMEAPAYNAFGWVSQGTWIFLQGACTWALNHREFSQLPLGFLDYSGVAVALAGLTIEHQADMQKTRWNAKFRSGEQTTFCREGLWKYSRHPNFFGENLVHLGLATIALSGLPSWDLWALALISPVWSCFFLVFTSLMLLEKRMLRRLGHLPSYQAYISTVPLLVPWPSSEPQDVSEPDENEEWPPSQLVGSESEVEATGSSKVSRTLRRRNESPAPRASRT
eukprot:TRINITY_DN21198_c0_g2_i1.p1 TRINITY_DN21198_c0_g2~~TRINITY_DN21198_c0_g2_i1.p1  ORF type:complete len:691 (-),score=44.93 TRINITY_DN21198_c0_g2_i1:383-2404(-)